MVLSAVIAPWLPSGNLVLPRPGPGRGVVPRWVRWFDSGTGPTALPRRHGEPPPARVDELPPARAGEFSPARDAAVGREDDPDRELLEEVLAEYPYDTRAFTRLVARHWGRAWGICRAVLLDPQDAEDATQDAFLKVHRYLPSFRFEARFSTWLTRITRNAALDLLAARRRESAARERVRRDPVLFRRWRPWKAPEPSEQHPLLWQAVTRLDPEDRLLLVLRELHGVPHHEIGETLGISEGAARMRALRARERLRGLLERIDRAGAPR